MIHMRIHTDRLTAEDIQAAARVARADVEFTEHGSRSRIRAFEVYLTGESRHRPNRQGNGDQSAYAATWDQWGVFLAELFAADDSRTFNPSRGMTCPYYKSAEDFASRTADRFGAPEDVMGEHGYYRIFVAYGWPEDAHGDHTFRYNGVPCEQSCTKCSAKQRWSI